MAQSLRSRKSVPKLPTKTFTMNDIREMEDLADELDVHIATREFEQAVENIEKGILIFYYRYYRTFIDTSIYVQHYEL